MTGFVLESILSPLLSSLDIFYRVEIFFAEIFLSNFWKTTNSICPLRVTKPSRVFAVRIWIVGILLTIFGFSLQKAYGQAPNPGDIAFTGMITNAGQEFAFVTLNTIQASQAIKFTNDPWDQNGVSFVTTTRAVKTLTWTL